MLKREQIDHINTVNWFHHNFPEYADDFHHFANERKCSYNEGRTLKKMGVKKGVLDFHLALPADGYHGLWMELKVGDGKLTEEQIAFINRKNSRGYIALAVWGHEAAKQVIITYLDSYKTKCFTGIPKNCS